MNNEIWDDAFVPDAKLTDYLLELEHPVGSSKAYVLLRAGFRPSDPVLLATALIDQARHGTVVARTATGHGIKLVVDGRLRTPGRRQLEWRTVWIIEFGKSAPRFVTAHPIRTQRSRS